MNITLALGKVTVINIINSAVIKDNINKFTVTTAYRNRC